MGEISPTPARVGFLALGLSCEGSASRRCCSRRQAPLRKFSRKASQWALDNSACLHSRSRAGGALRTYMGRRYAKIMARKQASELARVKLLARYGKRIIQASKSGGDVESIIKEAIEHGVPKDNIARALAKASASDQSNYEVVVYELYGPSGVGILVEALTDNLNRTAADVRLAARKAGFHTASAGSVQYLFERKGRIQFSLMSTESSSLQRDADALLLLVADAGAEDLEQVDAGDVSTNESEFLVWTPPNALAQVTQVLRSAGVEVANSELVMVPKLAPPEVSGTDRDLLDHGIEQLNALDDVDRVYTTLDPRPESLL
ncbi:Translational activator of mitochondrially encoded cytochrome c oxidase I [Cyanidiococcus yangmingshanensis]|uniref:Translational activator of mitochondrially encoded cytochrome c oxidase I n=1 Tax=Cyanidiococcus yangmingshanensis TaxID=2690220 RepID=A0A7J7INJ9_9RHOD|nr:Translational activator of mitochondrially encoded cytochrome c oxidase I [Cyanidiococcus yangmingshanensis]